MSTLSPLEEYWRDKQPWLLSCGYQLRPRYRPGWIPSWSTNPAADYSAKRAREDFAQGGIAPVMDAVRLSDDTPVMLKKIFSANHGTNFELRISEYVKSEEQRTDPDNHCIQIYEVLEIPDDHEYVIIVMPLLSPFNFPRFDTIGECLDFFQRIFKGLEFLHRRHIAHRNCTGPNVMMEPSEIFPEGFHPLKREKNREFTGPSVRKYTRTQRPPKYYWIDFGLSVPFHESDRAPLVYSLRGNDKSAPEFRDFDAELRQKRDPFPTDIYYLGNLIRMYFTEGQPGFRVVKKLGFEFMEPLVAVMVQEDSTKRPTIEQCVIQLEEIIRSQSSWTLRSQVWHSTDNIFGFIYRFFPHWARRIWYIVTQTPAIPQRSQIY